MRKSKSTVVKKHYAIAENLYLYVWGLVRDYSPEIDLEIRKLLEILNRQSENGVQKQGFFERLAKFWEMKIMFNLDEIWLNIREKRLNNKERETFFLAITAVGKMIDDAMEELGNIDFPYPIENFFGHRDLRLYQKSLESFLRDPFEEGEARIVSSTLSDGVWGYEVVSIGFKDQLEPVQVVIHALEKLAEDDFAGQMLRYHGYVASWPAGRIVVAGWNLSITETEEGEFLVSIEEMLAEMGGCPLGFVYDRKKWMEKTGYNDKEKTCEHCWKKDYCPGNETLQAWTLGALAKKLHYAWIHRGDILKVIPKFEKKLLK